METEVMNLLTGEKRFYTLPPEQAVVVAHYQSGTNANWNTWQYEKGKVGTITKSGRVVYCGDWSAMMEN